MVGRAVVVLLAAPAALLGQHGAASTPRADIKEVQAVLEVLGVGALATLVPETPLMLTAGVLAAPEEVERAEIEQILVLLMAQAVPLLHRRARVEAEGAEQEFLLLRGEGVEVGEAERIPETPETPETPVLLPHQPRKIVFRSLAVQITRLPWRQAVP